MDDRSMHRAKAEKIFEGRQPREPLALEEAVSLIRELDIQQIELEMVNEELRNIQIELKRSHDEYVKLFDDAAVGYFIFSLKGLIEKVNLTAARILAAEKAAMEGKPFISFLAKGGPEAFSKHLGDVERIKAVQVAVLELHTLKGASVWIKLMTIPMMDEAGKITGFSSAVVELTDLGKLPQT